MPHKTAEPPPPEHPVRESVSFLAAVGQALARVLWPFGRKPVKAKPEENPLEADVELDDPGIKKVLPYPIED